MGFKRFKSSFGRGKVKDFFDRKGFYIVLFACVCIIGATAYFTSGWNFLGLKNQKQLTKNDKGNVKQEQYEDLNLPKFTEHNNEENKAKTAASSDLKVKKNNPADTNPKKSSMSSANTAKAESASAAAKPNQEVEIPKLIMPVSGQIIMPFAEDALVFSSTLGQWTTHSGIDIASKEGTEVKAVLGGTVEKVEKDEELGYCITIDHGGNLETRYCNLSTLDMVEQGKKVKRGQTISAVGRTSVFESGQDSHLHFEVIYKGKKLNPSKYFINQ